MAINIARLCIGDSGEVPGRGRGVLAMHELEVEEPDCAAESRGYIQDWLSGATPDDSAIRAVFVATDQILKSGGTQSQGGVG